MQALEGLGASEGTATGVTRWIETAEDTDSLVAGEILLARMTSPDWGAVYQRAAAVATEEGGMLCHAALVAREERIPAVVGIGVVLRTVPSGSTVTVDGENGLVLIHE